MTMRVVGVQSPGYYVEMICAVLTVYLIAEALFKNEDGLSREEADQIGFRKILAAHSFTWLAVQTMFVYMFAFVQDKMPGLADVKMGQVVSISFLVLNAVGALLPAFVLEPITKRIGRVRTHMACIAIMAGGYALIPVIGGSTITLYVLMGVVGVGWAATVSLPFAIILQSLDAARMGLYMGLFNLSVVLPQLVASLGVGEAISAAPDKSIIFWICAGSMAVSAVAWLKVREPVDHSSPVP